MSDAHNEKLKVEPNPWLYPTRAEEIETKIDHKTKIHLEKFKELYQLLNERENNIRCDNFEIDEFKKIKKKQHDFLLLHLNILSSSLHINEMVTFLNLLETKFNTIGITESRFSQKKNPLASNINIPRYNIEHKPAETSMGRL